VRILRGFLKDDEFGLGRGQVLRLQQQIVHVAITTAAPEQSFDVPVTASITPIGTFVRQ